MRLRARAKQLGDLSGEGVSPDEVPALAEECAYEHWHRMLFARFLAENHLLMHPSGVAVTLRECEELAPAQRADDGWDLASLYAERMLPHIFRSDTPVLELKLPIEHRRALENLLDRLTPEVFRASDSLGWAYQYWQTKRKDEVNRSEAKIGAKELPAVTQLFTEPYMVDFLLENTLGAWWAGRHPGGALPIAMPYLRLRSDGTPVAGTFDGWPRTAKELRILDPCCGSGHFLVAAFRIVVSFRMAAEGLGANDACNAVLQENLFGLEIDSRCTQIAAFALALAAWTYPGSSGHRPLPQMHIACSGLAISTRKEQWLALAGANQRLRDGMASLYDLFKDAPLLGSLIDPTQEGGALVSARFEELQPLLDKVLEAEGAQTDFARNELGVTAKGIAEAAGILAHRFHLIATNVPYLARKKQDPKLADFCSKHASDSRNDLATVFLERLVRFGCSAGTVAAVLPQNWLFLTSYSKLRVRLLGQCRWQVVVKLGAKAFKTVSGEVVRVALIVISLSTPENDHRFVSMDTTAIQAKPNAVRIGPFEACSQMAQLDNPDARIVGDSTFKKQTLLSTRAHSHHGLTTGDLPRMRLWFWEVDTPGETWVPIQGTVEKSCHWGGMSGILRWCGGKGALLTLPGARRDGTEAWGKRGVLVSQMADLPVTLYSGGAFDNNSAVIIPFDPEDLPAIWCYCSSPEFRKAVRKIDQKLSVTNSTLVKVPFDLDKWRKVAASRYPNGLPARRSDDPTQWVFDGTINPSTQPLQVAVARLLGYCWPSQKPDSVNKQSNPDGIVCIPSIRGEQPAATRVLRLLADAYGDRWGPAKLGELLSRVGHPGISLEYWLLNSFFDQHCSLFRRRPFMWHVWDGRKDGFSALVNYHKLNQKGLENLTYNYLGDWISRQQDGLATGVIGAAERLRAARLLQRKLECILEGEEPHDIFVRWKPLHQQPLGWHPELSDGVRVNIRPFMQAGVLRKNPRIDWKNDRGKDPVNAPWGQTRINNVHLTLARKTAARRERGTE